MAEFDVGDGSLSKTAEAYLHDERLLPHEIGGDLNLLSPKANAAAALQERMEDEDFLETRGPVIGRR